MLQWWLNYRWVSSAHADTLVRIDFAVALFGIMMLVAIGVGG